MQTIYEKRLPREIQFIEQYMPSYSFHESFLDENEKMNKLEIVSPHGNILRFSIPNDYPFKAPVKLECNGYNYRFLLKNMPTRIHYLYTFPNEVYFREGVYIHAQRKSTKCICCSGLLCPENWSPVMMIHHILSEIDGHNRLKQCIMYKLVLKDIFEKKNIPFELIRNTFEYLTLSMEK
jgi:hypothetical protein